VPENIEVSHILDTHVESLSLIFPKSPMLMRTRITRSKMLAAEGVCDTNRYFQSRKRRCTMRFRYQFSIFHPRRQDCAAVRVSALSRGTYERQSWRRFLVNKQSAISAMKLNFGVAGNI